MTSQQLWERFQQHYCSIPGLGLSLDISRMRFGDDFFVRMEPEMQRALGAMEALEKGAVANPDENRMVGHYWLRTPELAPDEALRRQIKAGVDQVRTFAAGVHAGEIKPPTAPVFTRVLSIGIGGSALGPMFVADALGHPTADRMPVTFIDNTDPDGIERILANLDGRLGETLCVVTSKSGGTPETRNGMLLMAEAYRKCGLAFGPHAVAITMPGSAMDKLAREEKWLERFPMFDWVGGRTSEMSAVGLLPAALQGLDVDGLLAGAAACDAATRNRQTRANPAALLALMWYHATGGLVLPYKDRLLLFSRYLQQLIMESLGKQLDLSGERVEQGISVYGNKGSTDQHAYVQQLRDGIHNFFVVFVRVLESGGPRFEVEPGVTSGDYLHGFLLGTRSALFENGRESLTLTVTAVNARAIGALIALFERAVGLYAALVGINAYHQPGVEAGKKAAAAVLSLQRRVEEAVGSEPLNATQVAKVAGAGDQVETVCLLLEHLAANGVIHTIDGTGPSARFVQRS
jgi:glucose-6-phosphate isomerase